MSEIKKIESINFNNYFPDISDEKETLRVIQESDISINFGVSKKFEETKRCILEIEINVEEYLESDILFRDVNLRASIIFEVEKLTNESIFLVYIDFLKELLSYLEEITTFKDSPVKPMSFEDLIEESEKDRRNFIPKKSN